MQTHTVTHIHTLVHTNTLVHTLQKEWRKDYHGEFKKKVMRCVRKSQDSL